MDISLNDSDIKKAITTYVNHLGVDTDGKSIGITMKSGRKGNGFTAQVSISEASNVETLHVDTATDNSVADDSLFS